MENLKLRKISFETYTGILSIWYKMEWYDMQSITR